MKNTRKYRPKRNQSESEQRDDGIDEEIQRKLLDQLNAYGNKLLSEDEEDSRDSNQIRSRAIRGRGSKNVEVTLTSGGNKNNTTTDENSPAVKRKRKTWEENLHMELIDFKRSEKLKVNGEDRATNKEGPEVVVFEDRAKRKKESEATTAASGNSYVTSKSQLRELSHEVYQFGLSGFDFENKEKLEMQRAIKLGAKPPKNTHVPYKEFMKQQKEKKEEELKQREVDRKMGLQVKKKSERDHKRELVLRKSGFWQDPTKKRTFSADGQMGRFKSGVQVLSRQDIRQIKRVKGKSRGKRTKRS